MSTVTFPRFEKFLSETVARGSPPVPSETLRRHPHPWRTLGTACRSGATFVSTLTSR